MKTLSERSPIRFIAKLLAAFLLCLTIAVSLSVNVAVRADGGEEAPPDPTDPPEPLQISIGIVLPDTAYYHRVNQRIVDRAIGEDFTTYSRFDSIGHSQCSQVRSLISSNHIDVIIIAPVYADTDIYLFKSTFEDAKNTNRDLIIIVLGEVNTIFPDGTIFLLMDYYPMGENHVETMLADNPEVNEDSVIDVYYLDNYNGRAYIEGVKNAFTNHGDYKNVRYVPVVNPWHAAFLADQRLLHRANVQEIMTYISEISEEILQKYYANGYYDTNIGDGTGIRIFSYDVDEEEDIECTYDDSDENLTQTIFELILWDITGQSLSFTLEDVGEHRVAYYLDYVLGYSKYVAE